MTTYYESAEGVTIDEARAWQECVKHGMTDRAAFDQWLKKSVADSSRISAQAVLRFLGY